MQMKKEVYKYKVETKGTTVLSVPAPIRMLYVGMQGSSTYVWIECIPEQESTPVVINGVGTGCEAPIEDAYIGTVLNGQFVWHYYRATYESQ